MNFRIYIMAIATMTVGLVELLVGGILPTIAEDLNISLSRAGQLITLFALTYALAGPVLYSFTSQMERKRLYLITLSVFAVANILTYFSQNFAFIMIARLITAAATALIVILSVTIAARITKQSQQAKAIGFIYMGVSSALVFGVPLGVLVTENFGWRIIFLAISILAIIAMLLISWALQPMPGKEFMPLSAQLASLKKRKLLSAQLATVFMLAGHFSLYAYFTPYLQESMELETQWISMTYFAFGAAAMLGGLLGGIIATRIGNKKAIIGVLMVFALSLLLLPLSTFSMWVFIPVMMIWGSLSWALTPALQSYLINSSPKHAAAQQGFNSSAIQIGISLGAAIGGVALGITQSTAMLAPLGAALVVVALGCAVYSFSVKTNTKIQHTS